jgi:hypothetical protein
MTFANALQTYRERLKDDHSLKQRSKNYREERITALLKSWPDLKTVDVSQISKADCLSWAGEFGRDASPTAFNNTIGTLRMVLDVAVDRSDTSIENVLQMLRPIADEFELIGHTIPAKKLAQICRDRKSRLPMRGYNGMQMAREIDFLGQGGSIRIMDLDVFATFFRDPETNRRTANIAFERAGLDDSVPPLPKPDSITKLSII